MLHGNGEDHSIFYEALNSLKKYYQVYLIDSRGHGKSSPVSVYSYQAMSEDIEAFIKVLDLHDVILYGASDGAITGLLLCSQHPDLVEYLIISGANTNPRGVGDDIYNQFKLEYKNTRDPLIKMMLEQPHISNRELSKIKAKTLVLAGEYDLIKYEHTLNIKNNIIGSELMIIDGEDHGSYIVHNPKIAQIIIEYLKRDFK